MSTLLPGFISAVNATWTYSWSTPGRNHWVQHPRWQVWFEADSSTALSFTETSTAVPSFAEMSTAETSTAGLSIADPIAHSFMAETSDTSVPSFDDLSLPSFNVPSVPVEDSIADSLPVNATSHKPPELEYHLIPDASKFGKDILTDSRGFLLHHQADEGNSTGCDQLEMHQVQSTKGQLHCNTLARRQHFHPRQNPPHLYSRARHHQHPSHQEGNQVYSTEKHLYPCYRNHWQSATRKYHQWTSAFSPCTSQLSESCQQIQITLLAKRSSEFGLWKCWRSSARGLLVQGYQCWWSTSSPVYYRQHDSATLPCQKLVYWCNIQGGQTSFHTAT